MILILILVKACLIHHKSKVTWPAVKELQCTLESEQSNNLVGLYISVVLCLDLLKF